MNKPELTLENRLKQPSRLMTQYTSGRRGPFPLGYSGGEKITQAIKSSHEETGMQHMKSIQVN